MSTGPSHSSQRRGAKAGNAHQVSILNVFRSAVEQRDAKAGNKQIDTETGEREISSRSLERRQGASQSVLKRHLADDIQSLLNTVRLDAALDLDGLDHVQRSILNYGLQDLSRLTTEHYRKSDLIRSIRESLLNHEPRLIDESIEIVAQEFDQNDNLRVAFNISAEMSAKPVDVPLEFVAEIDVGAGKMKMSNLRVQT